MVHLKFIMFFKRSPIRNPKTETEAQMDLYKILSAAKKMAKNPTFSG